MPPPVNSSSARLPGTPCVLPAISGGLPDPCRGLPSGGWRARGPDLRHRAIGPAFHDCAPKRLSTSRAGHKAGQARHLGQPHPGNPVRDRSDRKAPARRATPPIPPRTSRDDPATVGRCDADRCAGNAGIQRMCPGPAQSSEVAVTVCPSTAAGSGRRVLRWRGAGRCLPGAGA